MMSGFVRGWFVRRDGSGIDIVVKFGVKEILVIVDLDDVLDEVFVVFDVKWKKMFFRIFVKK